MSDEGSLVGSSFVSTTWMEGQEELELVDELLSCFGERSAIFVKTQILKFHRII